MIDNTKGSICLCVCSIAPSLRDYSKASTVQIGLMNTPFDIKSHFSLKIASWILVQKYNMNYCHVHIIVLFGIKLVQCSINTVLYDHDLKVQTIKVDFVDLNTQYKSSYICTLKLYFHSWWRYTPSKVGNNLLVF